jgi:hypothetical protein
MATATKGNPRKVSTQLPPTPMDRKRSPSAAPPAPVFRAVRARCVAMSLKALLAAIVDGTMSSAWFRKADEGSECFISRSCSSSPIWIFAPELLNPQGNVISIELSHVFLRFDRDRLWLPKNDAKMLSY